MSADRQILKTRDDRSPIVLVRDQSSVGEFTFQFTNPDQKSRPDSDQPLTPRKLRARIEPWLSALFQSEHLSLLVGSGLTQGAHIMATGEKITAMAPVEFRNFGDGISVKAAENARNAERDKGNIEDQIRVANELILGLEILEVAKDIGMDECHAEPLREELAGVMDSFASSILVGESGLATANVADRTVAFEYLVSFLMSFASRTGTRERLHVFTTNYDRYIEIGADVAGLRLIDRFVGTLSPIFRASRLDVDMHYNPPGIRGEPRYLEGVARFTKLHGSVDWADTDGDIRRLGIPFGAANLRPYLDAGGLEKLDALRLMIYPNASKDQETTLYPYAELFRDFAAALCRPNSTLVTYGYSFGDDHINRVIKDMLTIPSTHLVVISFDDQLGRIMATYEQSGRPSQWTVMIGNHLGDLRGLVDNYLPKPAIDRTTIRMADLLKARLVNRDTDGDLDDGAANTGLDDS